MKTLILILLIAAVAYLAFRFLSGQKYKKSLFGRQKINDQSREVPLGGNVFANWWVEEHAVFLSFRSKKNERKDNKWRKIVRRNCANNACNSGTRNNCRNRSNY